MSLYDQWRAYTDDRNDEQAAHAFWNRYFAEETEAYKLILAHPEKKLSGKASEIAAYLGMEEAIFAGFLDGINTSLVAPIDVESVESDTELTLDIDFEKLYFNMHEAKADWLYNLKEWDGVLSSEKRREIARQWRASKQFVNTAKVGPNDPCPCGSGKKYKKCCGRSAD